MYVQAACVFLVFCPQHGHCYGGHLIHKAEGRIDPMSLLYCFKPTPPKVFFYDYVCGFDIFASNRENAFVAETEMYHDVFHGVTHKSCSKAYTARRFSRFNYYNTSICEQFNSFLKCIRHSARNMSQPRFVFFVSFLIAIWNMEKEKQLVADIDAFAKLVW
jgi:hypothetical protein